MPDRLMFIMPEKLEIFIPAMAAVQSMCDQLEKQNRPDYELHVVASNPFSFFECCFKKVVVWSEGNWRVNTRGYDLVFEFDEEKAYAFGETSKLHIAKAFGTLIGSDPVNDYPTTLGDLSEIKTEEPAVVKDVLGWNLPSELEIEIANFCTERDWSFTSSNWCTVKQNNVRELYKLLTEHKMIVGMRSSGTYLASSMKKRVVEIYPSDKYKNWLSKWANPYYYMVYGNQPELVKITRAMDVAWNRKPEWVDSTESSDLTVRR